MSDIYLAINGEVIIVNAQLATTKEDSNYSIELTSIEEDG